MTKRWVCSACADWFKNEEELIKHQNICTQYDLNKCPHCGKNKWESK